MSLRQLTALVAVAAVAPAVIAAPFVTRPGTGNCTLSWFQQTVDHFSVNPPLGGGGDTYQQRVFS